MKNEDEEFPSFQITFTGDHCFSRRQVGPMAPEVPVIVLAIEKWPDKFGRLVTKKSTIKKQEKDIGRLKLYN